MQEASAGADGLGFWLTNFYSKVILRNVRIHATLQHMMNTQSHQRKAQRLALHGLASLALASLLLGCATEGASSRGASNQGTGGSRVEAYGEIDMGYGYSRTKTVGERK